MRLHKLIERLVPWEASNDENVLKDARWEIARSIAWNLGEDPPSKSNSKAVLDYLQTKAPPVYDPFSGGGTIPLEAQRLGLRAYGSDLNPVAVLIGKMLVEIAPKFAGQPPRNPESRAELARGGQWQGRGGQGLADDIRYYGRWMLEQAHRRVGDLYADVEVTKRDISEQPHLAHLAGRRLKVFAWLWARTVKSPDPAFRSASAPLINTFNVVNRDRRNVVVKPTVSQEASEVTFAVVDHPSPTEISDAAAGTKAGRGAFRCLFSNSPISPEYLRDQGKAGAIAYQGYCVVALSGQGKVYLSAEGREFPRVPSTEFLNNIKCPEISGYFNPPIYGYDTFGSLFLDRQRYTLSIFCSLVEEAKSQCERDGASADYALAVAIGLTLGVSRMANRMSSFSIWDTGRETIQQMFSEQGVPMAWDFAEANPFSGGSGSWEGSLEWVPLVIERSNVTPGTITLSSAQRASIGSDLIICTDPPYYSSITYADFADYFYGVMRACLRTSMPELFATAATPKIDEAVAAWHRFGGDRAKAGQYFTAQLAECLRNTFSQSNRSFPKAVFYAFKAQDIAGDSGKLISAWESILTVLLNQGMLIESTFPLRTEQSGGRKAAKNSLASSIVIVGRDRPGDAPTIARSQFLRELKRELPRSVKILQDGNIAPVDLAQASIGPGMAVFSRYAQVLEADGSSMTVRSALVEINRVLDETLAEQEGDMDADTRFCVAWFEQYGMLERPYGEADVLFTAKNTSFDRLERAGIVVGGRGKVRLKRRDELDPSWAPRTDTRLADWECAQQLVRTLTAELGGGVAEAARLVSAMGPRRAENARTLAYRLYTVSERKGWTEEALAYNILVTSWPQIQAEAAKLGAAGSAQSELAL